MPTLRQGGRLPQQGGWSARGRRSRLHQRPAHRQHDSQRGQETYGLDQGTTEFSGKWCSHIFIHGQLDLIVIPVLAVFVSQEYL